MVINKKKLTPIALVSIFILMLGLSFAAVPLAWVEYIEDSEEFHRARQSWSPRQHEQPPYPLHDPHETLGPLRLGALEIVTLVADHHTELHHVQIILKAAHEIVANDHKLVFSLLRRRAKRMRFGFHHSDLLWAQVIEQLQQLELPMKPR